MEVRGAFVGPFNASASGVLIPRSALPDAYAAWRDDLFTGSLLQGAASIEDLVGSGEAIFRSPWPVELLGHLHGRVMIEGFVCTGAWKEIPRGAAVGVLDAVRNKVLGFALEIEAANPGAGDVAPNADPPVSQERVEQIALTVIGDRNIFAAGSGASVRQVGHVMAGDWNSLAEALRHVGVEEGELEALQQALDADRGAGIGPATESWLGRMASKALSGAAAVAPDAVGGVIGTLILKFLGIS